MPIYIFLVIKLKCQKKISLNELFSGHVLLLSPWLRLTNLRKRKKFFKASATRKCFVLQVFEKSLVKILIGRVTPIKIHSCELIEKHPREPDVRWGQLH